jgi:hypothetical protein
MLKKVTFRFYEELNDFLPSTERKKRFEYSFMDLDNHIQVTRTVNHPMHLNCTPNNFIKSNI